LVLSSNSVNPLKDPLFSKKKRKSPKRKEKKERREAIKKKRCWSKLIRVDKE